MPRQGSFRYELRAPGGDVDEAVALLSDFSRHAELHPLIVRVTPAPAPEGVLRRYLITDRIVLGPVRFPVTYTADVLRADADRVVTLARQRPGTTVRNDTRLSVVDAEVRAVVEITLTAPTPLFGFAVRQARAAHAVLADRLRAALTH
jgi:hypothetical protein